MFHPLDRRYECNLCHQKFSLQYYFERHFYKVCFRNHAHTHPKAQWDDRPSCTSHSDAQALSCARPFYPYYQTHNETTCEYMLSWPSLSGWPTSPEELARKNAAHVAIPGANPYYIDTRENVYADVAEDQETNVAGENPLVQVANFIQLVDSRSVALLLGVVRAGTWSHGLADDVFFAVTLHLSEERVAKLLECRIGIVRLRFAQAQMAIFKEHVRVSVGTGPRAKTRPGTSKQGNMWKDIVQTFREMHAMGNGGEWKLLPCCEGGRIEKAFAEAADDN